MNFNTSYVLVQVDTLQVMLKSKWKFQYIICFGSSGGETSSSITTPRFQYIICFGSR